MAREERDLNMELRKRERDVQRQEDENRIENSRYNKVYKEIYKVDKMSEYLEQAKLKKMEIEKVRTLIKIRCGNVEKNNKYWLEEDSRKCMFCEKGKDTLRHYIEDCNVTKDWFVELGDSVEKRFSKVWNSKLYKEKDILRKLENIKEIVDEKGKSETNKKWLVLK